MDFQSLLALIFIVVLLILVVLNRKKIEFQKILFPILYFALYRTKLGLKWMDRISSISPKFWRMFYTVGIGIGFAGMIWISYTLIESTISLFTQSSVTAGIMPVLPFEAKGVFFVPFIYWIVSIFIIAGVHEFSHGIAARAFNIRVKSSGFAVLGIIFPVIPAAFVEPDEKQMAKKSRRAQLAVLSAGPLANLVTAVLVILLVIAVINPVLAPVMPKSGIEISKVEPLSAAAAVGLEEGDIITKINNVELSSVDDFTTLMSAEHPNDRRVITTQRGNFAVTLGSSATDQSKAFLGVYPKQHYVSAGWLGKIPYSVPIIEWINGLLFWLFSLNIGIGVFNLLPLGPVDGGRMFLIVCEKLKMRKLWVYVSLLFTALIFINLFSGFVK